MRRRCRFRTFRRLAQRRSPGSMRCPLKSGAAMRLSNPDRTRWRSFTARSHNVPRVHSFAPDRRRIRPGSGSDIAVLPGSPGDQNWEQVCAHRRGSRTRPRSRRYCDEMDFRLAMTALQAWRTARFSTNFWNAQSKRYVPANGGWRFLYSISTHSSRSMTVTASYRRLSLLEAARECRHRCAPAIRSRA